MSVRLGWELATISFALALLLAGTPAPSGGPAILSGGGPVPPRASPAAHAAPAAPAPTILKLTPSSRTWSNVTRAAPGASPPAGYDASVAYDAADRATVLFGGCLQVQCPSDQTWVFANGTWTNITRPSDAPPARESAAMTFDARMGGLLLFGGLGPGSVPRNDTWLFQGGRWSNVSYIGGGPSPRYGAMMAFDPAPEENGSVLYGGCVPAGFGVSCHNDTWVWQGGSGWVPLAPSQLPPAVGFGAMAYDPAQGSVVLFGGCAGFLCGGVNNQTWVLYSGQWWPLHESTLPSPRWGEGLVYDPDLGALLLFGGVNATFVALGDSWSFSAAGWQPLAPSSSPPPRYDYGLALDPTGRVPILLGGSNASMNFNDTWAFEAPLSAGISASPSPQEAGAPVRIVVTVAGGSGSYGAAVTLGDGDGAWAAGAGPSFALMASYAVPGQYLPGVNVTDSAGETSSATASAVRIAQGPAVTVGVDRSQVDVGVAVHLGANATGGASPPFAFTWSFGDGATSVGPVVAHTYSAPGVYSARANLSDAAGASATAAVSVTVAPWPAVSILLGGTAPNTSGPVALLPSVTGGTGPVSFAWSFGDGAASALPSPSHRYSAAGTYTVELWANDSGGGSAHATRSITVAAGPTPSGPSTHSPSGAGTPIWFWPGLGAIAAIVVVGSILLVRRGRS